MGDDARAHSDGACCNGASATSTAHVACSRVHRSICDDDDATANTLHVTLQSDDAGETGEDVTRKDDGAIRQDNDASCTRRVKLP